MKNFIKINGTELKSIIAEAVMNVLNESFSSKILQDVFDKNHEYDRRYTSKHINTLKDIYFNNMWEQYLSKITDDMIDGIYSSPEEAQVNRYTPYMEFNNGVTVVFNNKIRELQNDSEQKFNDRWNRPSTVRQYKVNYYSRNPYYNDFMSGKGMWNNDIKNGDKPYFNGNRETTPSNVKQSHYKAAKNWYKNKK